MEGHGLDADGPDAAPSAASAAAAAPGSHAMPAGQRQQIIHDALTAATHSGGVPASVQQQQVSELLGGPTFGFDYGPQGPHAQQPQATMLAGLAGSSGVVAPMSAVASAGPSGVHLTHAAPPPSSLAAALGAVPAQASAMSTTQVLEQLTAALSGAVAMPALRGDTGHDAAGMDAATAALGIHLGMGFAGDGIPGSGAAAPPLPLPDHPGLLAIPTVHAAPGSQLASGKVGRAGKPKAKGPPRKRSEIPNPGVNGSLGGATPAAIQAEGGFQCPLCDRVYKSESGLRLHRRTVHEGFRGYPCPHCSKLFTQKSHVKTHVRAVHEGKRDYGCPVCTKLFTRASNRDRHVRTVHRNANIHPCDMCERVFVSEASLRDHKATHHGSEHAVPTPLLCPQCHTAFTSKGVLNHHMRTVHGGEPTGPGSRGGKPKSRSRGADSPDDGFSPGMDDASDAAHLAALSSASLFPTGPPAGHGMADMPIYPPAPPPASVAAAAMHSMPEMRAVADSAAAAAAAAMASASAGLDVAAMDADFGAPHPDPAFG